VRKKDNKMYKGEGKKYLGECFGVRLDRRGTHDSQILCTILCEDDGNWVEIDKFDSSWIDEFIEQLQLARRWMKKNCNKGCMEMGYKFKEIKEDND
jgi:hypothetical protein